MALISLILLLGHAFISNRVDGLLIGFALTCLMVVLLPQFFKKQHDLLEPLNFVALTTFIGTTMRTMYIVIVDNYNTRSFLLLGKPTIVLAPALIVILLGLIALLMGYSINRVSFNLSKVRILHIKNWHKRRFLLLVIVLSIISALAMAIYIQRLGIQGSILDNISGKRRLEVEGADYKYAALGYYLWGASLLSYVFYIVFAMFISKRPVKWFSSFGFSILLLFFLASIFPIFTSSRTDILLLLVYSSITWHYLYSPISFRAFINVITAILLLFVGLGFLRSARGQVDQVTGFFSTDNVLEVALGNRNWLGVDKTAQIIDSIPHSLSYQNGQTLVTWLFAPIPRTMWPAKPPVRIGPFLGETIFGRDLNKTGVPPGFIGELYMNFGIIGVLIGMFLLGLLLKTLYLSFYPLIRARNANAVLVYMLILVPFSLTLLGSDVAGVMITTIIQLVTITTILLLINKYDRVNNDY
jgi:oligosaccharide repeat unit polymerase